jgi:hypothetical protein
MYYTLLTCILELKWIAFQVWLHNLLLTYYYDWEYRELPFMVEKVANINALELKKGGISC